MNKQSSKEGSIKPETAVEEINFPDMSPGTEHFSSIWCDAAVFIDGETAELDDWGTNDVSQASIPAACGISSGLLPIDMPTKIDHTAGEET